MIASALVSLEVATKNGISRDELSAIIEAEWENLRAAGAATTVDDTPRSRLLSRSFEDAFELEPLPSAEMGFGLSGAAFLVMVKAVVGSKPFEVVMSAVAKELLHELFARIKRKRGADFVELKKDGD